MTDRHAVAGAIRAYRYRYADEARLQEAIAVALERAGLDAEREVRLAEGRIDFVVGGVGVEVKVLRQTAEAVLRQLAGYARSGVRELVLVTNRDRGDFPDEVEGAPLEVVSLALNAL